MSLAVCGIHTPPDLPPDASRGAATGAGIPPAT